MNPFENIKIDINKQSNVRGTIEDEIAIFEERILSIKREINNIEELIEINNFYKRK